MNNCCKCLFLSILNIVLYIVLNQPILTNIKSSIHSFSSRGGTNHGILSTKVKLEKERKIWQNNFRKTFLSWCLTGDLKSNKTVINYLVLKKEKNNQKNCMKISIIRKGLKKDPELNSLVEINLLHFDLFLKTFPQSKYNLLWCPVFKAASTNWMKNIITLSGYTEQQAIFLQKKFPG